MACYKRANHEMYCADFVPFKVNRPTPINRCVATSHYYQHVQESGKVFLYCRQCADIVPISLTGPAINQADQS